jgi:quinol monooxygenase YgiN
MVIVILRIVVQPKKKSDAIRAIRMITGPTTTQPDCMSCQLYSDVEDRDSIVLFEQWKSREGLERHIRSDEFRKILAVMEMATVRPEMSFNVVASTEGMELVEKLLSGSEGKGCF